MPQSGRQQAQTMPCPRREQLTTAVVGRGPACEPEGTAGMDRGRSPPTHPWPCPIQREMGALQPHWSWPGCHAASQSSVPQWDRQVRPHPAWGTQTRPWILDSVHCALGTELKWQPCGNPLNTASPDPRVPARVRPAAHTGRAHCHRPAWQLCPLSVAPGGSSPRP